MIAVNLKPQENKLKLLPTAYKIRTINNNLKTSS